MNIQLLEFIHSSSFPHTEQHGDQIFPHFVVQLCNVKKFITEEMQHYSRIFRFFRKVAKNLYEVQASLFETICTISGHRAFEPASICKKMMFAKISQKKFLPSCLLNRQSRGFNKLKELVGATAVVTTILLNIFFQSVIEFQTTRNEIIITISNEIICSGVNFHFLVCQ